MARFYFILSIMGQEIRFPIDLPDGTDLESLRGNAQAEIAAEPAAAPALPAAKPDPIESAVAALWKNFPNRPKAGVIFRRGHLHDTIAEIPDPDGDEPEDRYGYSQADVRNTLRGWGGVWDSDALFNLAVRTAELRRKMKREAAEIERYTARLSCWRSEAVRRAQTTDDVFIPYCHYKNLHGAIVRKDALEGHFDALYDRACRVLWFGNPRGRSIRIERETETHVHFVRA